MSGIDHLVLAVHDLDAARKFYESLGFTLTPEARHPFGTANSLVQLDNVFLELVTVRTPDLVPEPTQQSFSFAAFNRDFLRHGEGFSMLVMESEDAKADRQRFQRAGLRAYQPFEFSRKTRLPDGEEATVGFSLAFVSHPDTPNAGFFTCQQHHPQHFWKPEYQQHANTAWTVLDVWLVTDRPLDLAEFLQTFAAVDDVLAADGRLTVRTKRGDIVAGTANAFEAAFGVPPSTAGREPCFGGFTVGVEDLGAAARAIDSSAVSYRTLADALVIGAERALGAVIAIRRTEPRPHRHHPENRIQATISRTG